MDASYKKVVLLGKTGAGKSSTANNILQDNFFDINQTSLSGTSACQAKSKSVNGTSITLIDTPGFLDTRMSEEDLKPKIIGCVTEFAPEIHAFLIVLQVGKFTEEEQKVITKIKEYFSEEAFSHAIVVFTRGDQLEKGQTINDFVCGDENLEELVLKCGNRCHVIDNKYWNEKPMNQYRSNKFQVKEILQTLDKMVNKHNGSCYTNETLKAVGRMVQQERQNIKRSPGNMSEKEIDKKAKNNISKKLLIIFAGTATGVLLGLLFGALTVVKAGGRRPNETGGQISLGLLMAAAGVGAVIGGGAGYTVADKAETPQEAAEMAAKAVNKIYSSIKDDAAEVAAGYLLSKLSIKRKKTITGCDSSEKPGEPEIKDSSDHKI